MDGPNLYDDVVLTRDLDEYGLKRGDVATFIDTVPHPNGGPLGHILEVSNAIGESLKVIVVKADDIRPFSGNEIPAVRQLA